MKKDEVILWLLLIILPFCKAHNINLGYSDGKEVYPRSVTETNKAL